MHNRGNPYDMPCHLKSITKSSIRRGAKHLAKYGIKKSAKASGKLVKSTAKKYVRNALRLKNMARSTEDGGAKFLKKSKHFIKSGGLKKHAVKGVKGRRQWMANNRKTISRAGKEALQGLSSPSKFVSKFRVTNSAWKNWKTSLARNFAEKLKVAKRKLARLSDRISHKAEKALHEAELKHQRAPLSRCKRSPGGKCIMPSGRIATNYNPEAVAKVTAEMNRIRPDLGSIPSYKGQQNKQLGDFVKSTEDKLGNTYKLATDQKAWVAIRNSDVKPEWSNIRRLKEKKVIPLDKDGNPVNLQGTPGQTGRLKDSMHTEQDLFEHKVPEMLKSADCSKEKPCNLVLYTKYSPCLDHVQTNAVSCTQYMFGKCKELYETIRATCTVLFDDYWANFKFVLNSEPSAKNLLLEIALNNAPIDKKLVAKGFKENHIAIIRSLKNKRTNNGQTREGVVKFLKQQQPPREVENFFTGGIKKTYDEQLETFRKDFLQGATSELDDKAKYGRKKLYQNSQNKFDPAVRKYIDEFYNNPSQSVFYPSKQKDNILTTLYDQNKFRFDSELKQAWSTLKNNNIIKEMTKKPKTVRVTYPDYIKAVDNLQVSEAIKNAFKENMDTQIIGPIQHELTNKITESTVLETISKMNNNNKGLPEFFRIFSKYEN